MKRLLIVLVAMGLAVGASAQKIVARGGYTHFRGPRVIVGVGYSPFAPYYYSPYYSPWGYPYGVYGYRPYVSRPSKLDLEIQDIRLDYSDRIKSVKMDHSLRGKARRQTIRQLKNERDRAIVDAKRNYYYNRSSASRTPSSNGNNSNNNNNDGYDQ